MIRVKEKRSSSGHDEKRSYSRDRNCYNCGKPGHYYKECSAPDKQIEESPRRRSSRDDSPSTERMSREDRYEQRHSRRGKESEKKDKYTKNSSRRRHQAHVGEWVSDSEFDNQSDRSYHSDYDYSQDECVVGIALISSNSNDLFDSANEGFENCFMAKGPKVSCPEYLDFYSDEDDLLGEDDLLFDKTSNNIENELANYHDSQEKSNVDDKKGIERLTKESNTLKLANETTLEGHKELKNS